MSSVSHAWWLSPVVLLLASCGGEPRGGPRVDTHPIQGQVLVDGQPAYNLLVKCNPESDVGVVTTISGFTDKEGKFSIGTYESGDGAPEGEYKLTFMWGQWGLNGRYGKPDKLNGRYLNVAESQVTANVKKGQPTDLGEIKLLSK